MTLLNLSILIKRGEVGHRDRQAQGDEAGEGGEPTFYKREEAGNSVPLLSQRKPTLLTL